MVLISQYVCPIFLALSFLFIRAQGERILIGYRTVNEAEALAINSNNKPTRDERLDRVGPVNQLGHAFYMTNDPIGWPGYRGVEKWYCYIKADVDKMREVGKVWIPHFIEEENFDGEMEVINLWRGNEEDILDYIHSMLPDTMPEKVLRFSYISFVLGRRLQMAIPTAMVNNDDLDLWAQCFDKKKDLWETSDETVLWENWGIVGDPGRPSFQ
ncbi:hypothetical protein MBM_01411 [Drepanopeziza brunnea f. sp. 'multigermtubi' MB_m1]|uniref:Uncharacterized protein n=1 Tax=Marssonina brunnea f. sp. multigermtubi (strain MB_m1) TaxID=1072389 RepID=K1Y6B3_MARBU|nr:uncharacterized protein MBM_01411 [Drepanopeziza brunnea f. sp. 'multigermtubi' MB_m1]EKD20729.1 hypothetical protein MBM_01411 [Drepanopeziza brunnea f. sp. 'multigermtubi' MB_m1]